MYLEVAVRIKANLGEDVAAVKDKAAVAEDKVVARDEAVVEVVVVNSLSVRIFPFAK
jgi:hypothetical protein